MDPYLFQTAGKQLDLISVHEYWVANYREFHTPDYLTCMMLAEKPEEMMILIKDGIVKLPPHSLMIVRWKAE